MKMCDANRAHFKTTGDVASSNKFQQVNIARDLLFLKRFIILTFLLKISKFKIQNNRPWQLLAECKSESFFAIQLLTEHFLMKLKIVFLEKSQDSPRSEYYF